VSWQVELLRCESSRRYRKKRDKLGRIASASLSAEEAHWTGVVTGSAYSLERRGRGRK